MIEVKIFVLVDGEEGNKEEDKRTEFEFESSFC